MPALIFDLDGTLVDTVYAHVFAWQRALAEAGMAIDAWRIHRRIGMSGGLFTRAVARELGREIRAQEVEVQIAHEKTFNGIKIKFIDMLDDSRCPKDTTCVWAGNARISVQVSRNGKKKIVELNTGRGLQAVVFEGYEFTLAKLTPEPASNVRIRKDGYVATFKVAKKQ